MSILEFQDGNWIFFADTGESLQMPGSSDPAEFGRMLSQKLQDMSEEGNFTIYNNILWVLSEQYGIDFSSFLSESSADLSHPCLLSGLPPITNFLDEQPDDPFDQDLLLGLEEGARAQMGESSFPESELRGLCGLSGLTVVPMDESEDSLLTAISLGSGYEIATLYQVIFEFVPENFQKVKEILGGKILILKGDQVFSLEQGYDVSQLPGLLHAQGGFAPNQMDLDLLATALGSVIVVFSEIASPKMYRPIEDLGERNPIFIYQLSADQYGAIGCEADPKVILKELEEKITAETISSSYGMGAMMVSEWPSAASVFLGDSQPRSLLQSLPLMIDDAVFSQANLGTLIEMQSGVNLCGQVPETLQDFAEAIGQSIVVFDWRPMPKIYQPKNQLEALSPILIYQESNSIYKALYVSDGSSPGDILARVQEPMKMQVSTCPFPL